MTQAEKARKGLLTPGPEGRRQGRRHRAGQAGRARRRRASSSSPSIRATPPPGPPGIGRGLRTKVNVNLGTSRDFPRLADELRKVEISLDYGADALMDLSTGGDLRRIRKAILARTPIPVGTVPIYQAAVKAIDRRESIVGMTEEDLFEAVESQAREGVDFMTVHSGLTLKAIDRLKTPGPGRRRRLPGRGLPRRLDAPQRKRESLLRPLRPPARDRPAPRRHPQPGRRPAARLHPRRDRPAPDRGAADARRAGQAGPGSGGPGHGRGPGPRPARPGRDEHAPGEARLRRGAVLRPRPARHRHRARATTTSSRPSAGPSPRRPGPISCATSRRPSISACPRTTTSAKGSSPRRSPPTRATSSRGCPGPSSATSRWPGPASASTGRRSGASRSTRSSSRPSGSGGGRTAEGLLHVRRFLRHAHRRPIPRLREEDR